MGAARRAAWPRRTCAPWHASSRCDADDARSAAAMAQRIRAGRGRLGLGRRMRSTGRATKSRSVHGGELLRIDRLVRHRESGTWWVLDYKSAARPERDAALIAQMQRYRQRCRPPTRRAAVRAAFLTGQGELVDVVMSKQSGRRRRRRPGRPDGGRGAEQRRARRSICTTPCPRSAASSCWRAAAA